LYNFLEYLNCILLSFIFFYWNSLYFFSHILLFLDFSVKWRRKKKSCSNKLQLNSCTNNTIFYKISYWNLLVSCNSYWLECIYTIGHSLIYLRVEFLPTKLHKKIFTPISFMIKITIFFLFDKKITNFYLPILVF
jgi:hypothetical protein